MWLLRKELCLNAAHYLYGHKGECGRLHGHRWRIVVEIESNWLDEQGMVWDFNEIKQIVEQFDHQVINEIPPFDKLNPTAENLAQFFCDLLGAKSVEVWETPHSSVKYVRSE